MSKNKFWIYVIIVVVILVALFSYPRLTGQKSDINKRLEAAGLDCLVMGHTRLSQHIHPALKVVIDGQPKPIPANIGVTSTCMAEVHTHDSSGTIHIESTDAGETFTLGQFLTLWGDPEILPLVDAELIVDGQPYTDDPTKLILKDKQPVELHYKTK